MPWQLVSRQAGLLEGCGVEKVESDREPLPGAEDPLRGLQSPLALLAAGD